MSVFYQKLINKRLNRTGNTVNTAKTGKLAEPEKTRINNYIFPYYHAGHI